MENGVITALLLTLFAGLSTGIGSAIAFFSRSANKRFLAGSLGFSAGVMLYVSFVDIFSKAKDALLESHTEFEAYTLTVISFFTGIIVIMLIDRLIPAYKNPHEFSTVENLKNPTPNPRLYRIGIFTAIAIGIHNFPEGMATFTAYMIDPVIGVSIAIAIALHNIPEGIAVSVPVYYSTGSRKKAFWLSFSSGISEPVGAILGWILFSTILPASAIGLLFSAVGGIMVYIAIEELLPTAKEFDSGKLAIYSMTAGMAVMATSLIFLQA